jgi:hypothetical protein
MKGPSGIILFFLTLFSLSLSAQSALGKNTQQVIAIKGNNFTKLVDGTGMHILKYQNEVKGDKQFGDYTVTELCYFDRDTCVKDVSILPQNQQDYFISLFNNKYKPSIYHSWFTADSSFITISLRDGFLDISSFSADYYKKAGH